MRAAPTYQLYTWRQTAADQYEIRYRPTLWTVLHRLAITAVSLFIAGCWEWGHQRLERRLYEPVDYTISPEREAEYRAAQEAALASIGEVLEPEVLERIAAEAEVERAARARRAAEETARANQLRRVLLYVHYGIVGFFVIVGILPPLTCLWSRVTITRTPQGELAIRSCVLWPRTTRWPLRDFHSIRTVAKEQYGFYRRGGIASHNWVWYVQLPVGGQPQIPLSGVGGVVFGNASPQFQVYREKYQPSMIGKAPEPVRELVKALRALTGLEAEAPRLVEGRIVGRKKVAYTVAGGDETAIPVAHQEHVFRHGEAIPDDLRRRIAAMTGDRIEALGDGTARSFTQEITVTDEAGRQVSYGSIDELPEDVRRRLGL